MSDGLKAIFSYSSGNKGTRERLNANTVTVMTGTIGGTYVQFGADLASVLDDGDQMRVLPIVGRGSVQSIADILFLKGVDLGIMRADTLDYLERKATPATSAASSPRSPSSTMRRCTSSPGRRSAASPI